MNKKDLDAFRKRIEEKQDKVLKILTGNGDVGLCEKQRQTDRRLGRGKIWLIGLTLLVLLIAAASGITLKQIFNVIELVG